MNYFSVDGQSESAVGTTLTLYDALRKRETYRDQLKKIVSELKKGGVITYCHKNAMEVSGVPRDEIDNKLKSRWDKMTAVIDNIGRLTKAINQANATTIIVINGVEYTLVEAMAEKKSLEAALEIYESTVRNVADVNAMVQNKNNQMLTPEKATAYASKCIGALPETYFQKDGVDATTLMDGLKKEYMENNTLVVIDPYDLTHKMDDMRAGIESFRTQVDAEITKANLLTMITVDLS